MVAAAGIVELLTQFRVEIFAGGLLVIFTILVNSAVGVVSFPKQQWQPWIAAAVLVGISFIWLFTGGGWNEIFDRIAAMTVVVVIGGALVYRVLDAEVL